MSGDNKDPNVSSDEEVDETTPANKVDANEGDKSTSENVGDGMDVDEDDDDGRAEEQVEDGGEDSVKITFRQKSTVEVVLNGRCPLSANIYDASWVNSTPGANLESGAGSNGNNANSSSRRTSAGSPPNIGRDLVISTYRDGTMSFSNGRPFNTSSGGASGSPAVVKSKLKFKDCGGLERQISFLKTALFESLKGKGPTKSKSRFGLEPPKGILFHGPPGTGKTRLAQAISNELSQTLGKHVHFIYRKGPDVLSKYFGESSTNLRQVFEEAKSLRPTVLFFDELDGLCPSRDNAYMSEGYNTVVTTMLGLIDETERGDVFIIGATNRLDAIDPALRRPGRFDKYLEFLPPGEEGRCQILQIHTNNWKLRPPRELLYSLSEKTSGFSGADLAKLCQDAFDQCISRTMSDNAHLADIPFDDMEVEDEDWEIVLRKMKPSNRLVFGSTMYTPPQIPGGTDHVQPLIKENIAKLNGLLRPILPSPTSVATGIHSLYVCCPEGEISCGFANDFILAHLLRSKEVGSRYPVYCLSEEILSSMRCSGWPQKINSTFSQAVDSYQPAILFLQEVDHLWNMIAGARLETAVNLRQQLERLRGRRVVLLATGSQLPLAFPYGNPFKEVFPGVGRICKLELPSNEARLEFFAQLFNDINTGGMRADQKKTLKKIQSQAVDFSAKHSVQSMMHLYDAIQQELSMTGNNRFLAGTSSKLLSILTKYKSNGLSPN